MINLKEIIKKTQISDLDYNDKKTLRKFFYSIAQFVSTRHMEKIISHNKELHDSYLQLSDKAQELLYQDIEDYCGDEAIYLYRGLSFDTPNQQFKKCKKDQTITLKTDLNRYISSWTSNKNIARSFALAGKYGVIISTYIDIINIVFIPNMMKRDEYSDKYYNITGIDYHIYNKLIKSVDQFGHEDEYIISLPPNTQAVIYDFYKAGVQKKQWK